ncbi:MAG: DUF2520 domain-containing protein [Rhodothermales bacterium]
MSVPLDPEPLACARIAIVGAGAVGTALARRLHDSGYGIAAVISRDPARAAHLAAGVGAASGTSVADVPADVDAVFCCVPDDALPAVDQALALSRPSWTNALVAHTSGALPASALRHAASAGAAVLSFHPVQTFPPGTSPDVFAGIYVGIEGDPKAVAAAESMARRIGAHPLRIDPADKPAYHLACSLAANYLTTVLHVAGEALAPLGLDAGEAQQVLAPLVESAVRNARSLTPARALTGPLVRGDAGTLDVHLQALADIAPARIPLYLELAAETLRMSVDANRVPAEKAKSVAALLDAWRRRLRDAG